MKHMKHMKTVRVYRNLTAGDWSIQVKLPEGWRVRGHATSVELVDVKFHVGKSGRERVLREQCKNVHAWLEGSIDLLGMDASPYGDADRVAYNPYRAGTFTMGGTTPVVTARRVRLKQDGTAHAIGINSGVAK
jgi:hypothetical protein